MKSDPVVRTLADIADVTMGQSPKGETCNPDGIGVPLLNGPTEFGFRHPEPVQFTTDPKRFAEPGDLLFCVRGSTTGRMNWADQQYAIGRGIASIRGKNGFPTSYVRAVIEYRLDSLLLSATGSTFPNVGRSMLTDLSVPDHDVGAAVGIAQMLDTLDEQMWNLKDMNTTLESIAQAIFKSWFIDFDPVHAKAAGREPEGMDAETAALFPSEFEESELGPIPKGWQPGTIGDISRNARHPVDPQQLDSATPYIGLEHMPQGSIALNAWGRAGGLQSGKLAFQTNDILFGRLRPYFHKVGIAPLGGVCSTDILVLRPARADLHGILTMCVSSKEVIDYATRMSTGARMPRVSWKDLAAYTIVVPSPDVASVYQRAMDPLFEQIVANVASIQTLSALRDTLLPRLISGRLRIPEAEELVEEAVS